MLIVLYSLYCFYEHHKPREKEREPTLMAANFLLCTINYLNEIYT